jgi:hypothetical protein
MTKTPHADILAVKTAISYTRTFDGFFHGYSTDLRYYRCGCRAQHT